MTYLACTRPPARTHSDGNFSFLVPSKFRGLVIGSFMAKYSLPLSRLLGYEAIYYNLVFKDNVHAIRIYQKLGFRETGECYSSCVFLWWLCGCVFIP